MEVELMLIRHGAAKSNLEHRYLGFTDEPLAEEGREQLQRRKEEGVYGTPQRLYVSPMLRCRQTAAILFPSLESQCIPEWTEIDFGLFEGKTYQELSGNQAYQAWIESGGTLPFPEGEGQEEFKRRARKGFAVLLSSLQKPEQRDPKIKIAAVVHGGTIMALCSTLFEGDYFDYQIKCGEGFLCRFLYVNETIKTLELRRLC